MQPAALVRCGGDGDGRSRAGHGYLDAPRRRSPGASLAATFPPAALRRGERRRCGLHINHRALGCSGAGAGQEVGTEVAPSRRGPGAGGSL